METLTELTGQRLLDDTMTVLKAHIPLVADGYRCQTDDLWRVLIAAMAHQRSIEAACTDLATVPHPNTIRGYLADQWQPKELPALEAQVNAALRAALPGWLQHQPRHIAIDTHDLPFYGREDDPDVAAWVCHGQAKARTTAHYRCATAAVLPRDARVTLAIVFVHPGMTMAAIVAQVLAGIAAAKVRIACLYADKGFCSVGVIQQLERAQIPAIIAMPARGTEVKGLRRGAESRWAQHTLQSTSDGSVTVRVAVVRTYQRTTRKRRRATLYYLPTLAPDSIIVIPVEAMSVGRPDRKSAIRYIFAVQVRYSAGQAEARIRWVTVCFWLLSRLRCRLRRRRWPITLRHRRRWLGEQRGRGPALLACVGATGKLHQVPGLAIMAILLDEDKLVVGRQRPYEGATGDNWLAAQVASSDNLTSWS